MRSYLGTSNINNIAPWVHGAFTLKANLECCVTENNDHRGEWDTFKNYTPEVEISFSQYWLPERGI